MSTKTVQSLVNLLGDRHRDVASGSGLTGSLIKKYLVRYNNLCAGVGASILGGAALGGLAAAATNALRKYTLFFLTEQCVVLANIDTSILFRIAIKVGHHILIIIKLQKTKI